MTIAEANEPLSNGLKIIIAQKGLKNLYVAESAGYTPQELSDTGSDNQDTGGSVNMNINDRIRAAARR